MSQPWPFYQLVPVTESEDLLPGLQARVRDPLWLLCQQWQMGEFQGEDAAAPATATLRWSEARLSLWGTRGGSRVPVTADTPVETALTGEPLELSPWRRATLGQLFEACLRDVLTDATESRSVRAALLAQGYGLRPPDSLEGLPAREARFWRLMGGRALDGGRIATDPESTVVSAAPAPLQETVREASLRFRGLVSERWGAVGELPAPSTTPTAQPPPGWESRRLEHGLRASTVAGGAPTLLEVHPDHHGELDWYAFDLRATATQRPITTQTRIFVPGRVAYAGQPSMRYWDFEDSARSLMAMEADELSIARLVFLELLLVHGHDWFTLPLDLPQGSLCWIEGLTVTDVFGVTTTIPSSEMVDAGNGRARFSLFHSAVTPKPGTSSDLAPFVLVSPSYAAVHQSGPPREEVLLLRDELANLVWGIERTRPDGTGRPAPGHELAVEAGWEQEILPAPDPFPEGALRYRMHTGAPAHWIPFVARRLAGMTDQIVLQRAAIRGLREPRTNVAQGRILNAASPYLLAEEEVPRSGVRVSRVPTVSRTPGGGLRAWVRWQKDVGIGEGSSGLRFDVAEPGLK